MRKLTSVFLVFALLSLLLLMHGCVSETDVSVPGNEKVLSASAYDLDLDTVVDMKKYVFRPLVIDAEQSLVVQKSVSAAQTESKLVVKSTRQLTDADISRLETFVFEFDNARKDKERVCNQLLGLADGRCDSPKECAEMCGKAACQRYGYAGELLGYWVYDYSKKTKALESEVSDVKNAIVFIRDASSQEKEIMMAQLSSVMDRTMAVNNNPLLSENMFAICSQIDYNNNRMRDSLNLMGQYERTPSAYTYVISIKFVMSSRDYTELKISDGLPKAMLLSLKNVSLPAGVSYDQADNVINWEPVKFTLYPEYVVGYSFSSGQGVREDIFANWPTPMINMRLVSLSKSPTVVFVVEASKAVYSAAKGLGYYPALALVLALWDIIFFVSLMVAKIAAAFVKATQAKTGFKDSVLRAFGGANPHWREYGIACALFFVLGGVLMFLAAPVAEDALNVNNLWKNVAENPAGALSLLFFFLSLHAAYSLADDRLRGLIAGRKYYENLLEMSPKANELRLKKLQEKMNELTGRIAAAGTIDVSEEKNVLISLPMERIEALMKKEGNERAVKELVEVYVARIEAALVRVEEKVRITERYWPEWKKEIWEKINAYGGAPFSALGAIPLEWRAWAAGRYIVESEGEGLMVDAEGIKGTQASPESKAEAVLKKLIGNKVALGGAILKGDAVVSALSEAGNKTLEGILSLKVSTYARTLVQKALNAQYRRIVIAGSRNAAIFTKGFGDIEGVVFAPKDKAKDAYSELESRLKKI